MPSLRLFISHTAAHNIFIEQHIVPLANRYFSDHFYSNYRTANATTYKEHLLTGLTNCRWIVVTCAALRGRWASGTHMGRVRPKAGVQALRGAGDLP
jgi:hypothetical protein